MCFLGKSAIDNNALLFMTTGMSYTEVEAVLVPLFFVGYIITVSGLRSPLLHQCVSCSSSASPQYIGNAFK